MREQIRPPNSQRRVVPFLRITRVRPATPAIEEAGKRNPLITKRERRYRISLAVADAVSALIALVLSANVPGNHHLSVTILLGLPLVILGSKLSGLYDRDNLLVHKTTMDEAPALFGLATLYTMAVWMLDGVVVNGPLGKSQALVLWIALFTLGIGSRWLARHVAARRAATERLLLVGDAATYARLREKLEASDVNAKLVGRLSVQGVSDVRSNERPVDEQTLGELIDGLDAHRVIVTLNHTDPQVTLDLIRVTKALGVRVSLVPHVFDVVGQSVVFDDLGGMILLGVRDFALSRSSLMIKRAFDLGGALFMLLLTAPAFVAIALAIKLDSRGPVFFRQERIGRDGRVFRIFKFRSMVYDAERRKAALLRDNESQGLFKIANDPRVTRVGRFLRRTSLDELPQLINVVRGEMSLVGPRPLIRSEDQAITGYDRNRLHLTPGMTGQWQILGSARVPLHEMVKIDYLYVTTWNLFEDVKILVRTVPYMLARRGQ